MDQTKAHPATELIGEIKEHMFPERGPAPDCLPFPAGSMVPRRDTLAPPLLGRGLCNHDRALWAMNMWTKEEGSAGLNSLFITSVRHWAHLHPRKPQEPAPTALDMLDAWEAGEQIARVRVQEVLNTHKDEPTKKINKPVVAYARPAYACACHPIPADEHATSNAKESFEPALGGIRAQELMLRFWLKQLHSHHGVVLANDRPALRSYHRCAFETLRQLRQQQDTRWAPVAAWLTYPTLWPDWQHEKLRDNWYSSMRSRSFETTGRSVTWPPAFAPSTLGNPGVNLAQALSVWSHLGRPEDEVRQVDALARELAACMTDPWQLHRMPMTQTDMQAMTQLKSDWAKSGAKDRPRLEERLDDSHNADTAIATIVNFHSCTKWMSTRWDAIATARNDT